MSLLPETVDIFRSLGMEAGAIERRAVSIGAEIASDVVESAPEEVVQAAIEAAKQRR